MGTLTKWAEKEIDIACKRENPNWDGNSFDYGCNCYQSALKAFKSLTEDGHSGFSFNMTKNILIRLMENLPLTPIIDKDFFVDDNDWHLEGDKLLSHIGLKSSIQCPRMPSLFREESLDGKVVYKDNNRVYAVDINNNYSYFNGKCDQIVNEMFPIKMPYYPSTKKYVIYTEDFLTDPKNGDFDTKGYFYLKTPEGEKIEINKFEAETPDGWKEISREEYEKRKEIKIE